MSVRFAMIGCGHMGGAILRGILARGVSASSEWVVAEPEARKRRELERLGVQAVESARVLTERIGDESTLFVAVKPQTFDEVAQAAGEAGFGGMAISMMAGVLSERVRAGLGGRARVVRIMPNLPAQIGEGVTAVAKGAGATKDDVSMVLKLMQCVGESVEVEEQLIDAFTAVAGSGPAYVFLLAECMERGGVRCGLPNDVARLAARQTVIGAAQLLRESEVESEELRRQVTSKGGTTEAALRHMDERNVAESIEEAIEAARDRGRRLGNGPGPQ